MDQKQVLTFAYKYVAEVTKKLNPEQILLFGSYANNTATSESDIDIAVIFNGFAGDYMGSSKLLWKLTRGVSSYIEPVLLDRARDNSGFTTEVLKTGMRLYP